MKNTSKLVLALTVIVSFAFIKPKHSEPKKINIVIDAGHGGTDFGATSDAITEKKIVEQVTKKIKSLNSNVVIHFTRNEDNFLSLNDRTAFINKLKPDLVLSLHVNTSLNNKTSGLEFYVAKETEFFEKSSKIAGELINKFATNKNLKVSNVKTGPFYILKKSEVPAVIVELGYLTNENDKKYLVDDNEQNKIAQSISEFISEMK
ncbi:N-acetylmuramoyl-L-alanine amidase [Flavobacterium xinjiangense]|jgi:N-acetylmuramoyl-L-alanine amidase|uniref:N-acetylmuramoyl-L-alanine amidase n=1 Tax=Flavobacterium xinjiangense TaxID=178356 RepID=A0A1M7PDJ4_9FLAO|nr:N-acetylmuramoyl-L-alanine amidase [Flavobacterium xinjiangense]SHN15030.1 N-acetylmuramoyl-L-alanine amidase [Flavobacterium xinjiangense]